MTIGNIPEASVSPSMTVYVSLGRAGDLVEIQFSKDLLRFSDLTSPFGPILFLQPFGHLSETTGVFIDSYIFADM